MAKIFKDNELLSNRSIENVMILDRVDISSDSIINMGTQNFIITKGINLPGGYSEGYLEQIDTGEFINQKFTYNPGFNSYGSEFFRVYDKSRKTVNEWVYSSNSDGYVQNSLPLKLDVVSLSGTDVDDNIRPLLDKSKFLRYGLLVNDSMSIENCGYYECISYQENLNNETYNVKSIFTFRKPGGEKQISVLVTMDDTINVSVS